MTRAGNRLAAFTLRTSRRMSPSPTRITPPAAVISATMASLRIPDKAEAPRVSPPWKRSTITPAKATPMPMAAAKDIPAKKSRALFIISREGSPRRPSCMEPTRS